MSDSLYRRTAYGMGANAFGQVVRRGFSVEAKPWVNEVKIKINHNG